jgi:hypothetical protein
MPDTKLSVAGQLLFRLYTKLLFDHWPNARQNLLTQAIGTSHNKEENEQS